MTAHDAATRAASRDRLLRVMIAVHFNTAFNRNHTPESLTDAQVLYNEPRFGPLADAILAEPVALSRPCADVTEIAHEIAYKRRDTFDGPKELARDIAAALTARDARAKPSEDIESTARGITGDEDHEPLSALGHIIVAALQRERAHGDARATDAVAAEREALEQIKTRTYSSDGQCALKTEAVAEIYEIADAAIRRVPR